MKTANITKILVLIILASLLTYFAWGKFNSEKQFTITSPPPAIIQNPPPSMTPPPPLVQPPPAINGEEIVWANRTKNQVVFTFDGGAGNHSGTEVLDVLRRHNVKGTFFLTGTWVIGNQELARRMVQEGHEIFNHTYTHRDLTTLTTAEIKDEFARTDATIKEITGASTKPYFRPPYGARNSLVLATAQSEGYRSVYWTVDAFDWKEGISEAEVRTRIMNNLKPGTIYMMHIGDDITGNILDDILLQIKEEGYAILSLTEGIK